MTTGKQSTSTVTAYAIRGESCEKDVVYSAKATGRSVLSAARALAAEYEAHCAVDGLRLWVEIDGVVCDMREISITSPMLGARALIANCRTKAAHARMNSALACAI